MIPSGTSQYSARLSGVARLSGLPGGTDECRLLRSQFDGFYIIEASKLHENQMKIRRQSQKREMRS
jgi:hypothetical protein